MQLSEEIIIRHCSPTLAGIKTGNMFISPYKNVNEMRADIRVWNKMFSKKGIRVLSLRYNGRNALIYIYRPSMLSRDLQDESAYAILSKRGYGAHTPEGCIAHLVKRMRVCEEFPHEVGLFLGYPPEDVSGFIENRAGKCKCVGCWKVYGDEKAAGKKFDEYKKCTKIYTKQYSEGKTIERLTVAG